MKTSFFLVLIVISSQLLGQLSCQFPQYLRKKSIYVQNNGQELWYKFRAKGALLDFVGHYEQEDSLFEYEIYPFSDCVKIKSGLIIPIRSVLNNYKVVTREVWKRVIEEGICACPSCLSKINIDNNKPLRLKQGEFYLLKVLSFGKSFEFNLNFGEIDSLNPIQFSIDSIPFVEKSIPELKKLELFLKKHQVLKVQVRGHVNGPAQTKPSFYQSLSDERALVIKEFLVKNGVAKERVDAKGMSNFQMRYPSPKNPFQAKENRRVEIVILAVE